MREVAADGPHSVRGRLPNAPVGVVGSRIIATFAPACSPIRFALIAISSLIEALYAPGISGGDRLTTGQLLTLYTAESLLVGLASIVYSVLQR